VTGILQQRMGLDVNVIVHGPPAVEPHIYPNNNRLDEPNIRRTAGIPDQPQQRNDTTTTGIPDFVIHTYTFPENSEATLDMDKVIVIAYFRLKSKYDATKYVDDWMPHILSLRDHMVIFVEPDRSLLPKGE
jgi:hypothetical protein